MRFKRPQVRYADTEQPATPYQSAAQVWDERIGAPRVQAKNWRLMAFGLLVLGSPDPTRYTADMGLEFLTELGEVASAALARLLA